MKVCTARAGEGLQCGFFVGAVLAGAPCQYGLMCDPVPNGDHGTCRPLGQPGDMCWRNPVPPHMPCEEWCLFETPDAPTGRCGVPAANAPEHTPCVAYAGDSQLFCEPRMFSSALTVQGQPRPSCECLVRRAIGAACERADECAPSPVDSGVPAVHCQRAAAATDGGVAVGTCSERQPVGGPCGVADDCQSFVCDAKTSSCAASPPPAPPACP
jgi:hypothetical protein